MVLNEGLYSLSSKTSNRQISWNLEVERLLDGDKDHSEFNRRLGCIVTETPAKLQSDPIS